MRLTILISKFDDDGQFTSIIIITEFSKQFQTIIEIFFQNEILTIII